MGLKRKKAYEPPRLIVHGDLRSLTAGSLGANREAGPTSPKSKVGGSEA